VSEEVPADNAGQARVVLADDDERTRARLRATLEDGDFTVVAEVTTAPAAVKAARRLRPDLCLLELHMDGGGIPAARRIHVALPEAKIVVLTVTEDDAELFEALRAGACGYLVKDPPPNRLPETLAGVLAGEAALSRRLEQRLLDEIRRDGPGGRLGADQPPAP
jgi:DNA-binding NarL/FixJ family response regulator